MLRISRFIPSVIFLRSEFCMFGVSCNLVILACSIWNFCMEVSRRHTQIYEHILTEFPTWKISRKHITWSCTYISAYMYGALKTVPKYTSLLRWLTIYVTNCYLGRCFYGKSCYHVIFRCIFLHFLTWNHHMDNQLGIVCYMDAIADPYLNQWN